MTTFTPSVKLHMDGKLRVVHVALVRPIVDIEPVTFDLSFASVKQMAAEILRQEAMHEVKAMQEKPKLAKVE